MAAEIVDGKYHFEGEIDSLRPVLNIGSTNLSDPNATTRFMQIVLEPGTTRVAEDNNSPTGGLRISGTKGNEALYNFAVEGMAIQEGIKHSYTREMKERYFEQYEALLLKTIKRNCDNYTGVTMLLQSGERFPAELREKLYNRLSKRMKQTSAAQQIAKQLENRDPNN